MNYYVYCFIYNDKIIYVGKGKQNRYKCKSGRNKELLLLMSTKKYQVIFVKEDISENEALDLEKNLILSLTPEFNLNVPSKVKELTFSFCDEWFYFSDNSPTLLRWKKSVYSGEHQNILSAEKDSVAGKIMSKGYIRVGLNNLSYYVHRILYCLYYKKDLPSHLVINHLDGSRNNNCKINLELCTQRKNCAFTKRVNSNKTGLIGITIKTSKSGIASYYGQIRCRGILYEKGFSSKKHGNNALILAKQWLDKKKTELNVDCSFD